MRTYQDCVLDMQGARPELTARDIADMLGVHESVLSKRVSGVHKATHEAIVVVNIARDLICAEPNKPGSRRHAERLFAENDFIKSVLSYEKTQ